MLSSPLFSFSGIPFFRSRTVKTFRSYHRLHFVKYTLFAHLYCIFQLFICTDCFYHSDSSRLNLLHLDEAQISRYCDYARSLDQTLREPASAYGRDFLAEAMLTTILVFIGRIADSSSRLESRQTPPPAITATFRYIDDHLSESILL